MDIAELTPDLKNLDITVKVIELGKARDVLSKTGSMHRVSEALVGDRAGTILLYLWDDLAGKIGIGKSYRITNGYTTMFKGSLKLNIGKYGELKESTIEIGTVNKANNISEKEFG